MHRRNVFRSFEPENREKADVTDPTHIRKNECNDGRPQLQHQPQPQQQQSGEAGDPVLPDSDVELGSGPRGGPTHDRRSDPVSPRRGPNHGGPNHGHPQHHRGGRHYGGRYNQGLGLVAGVKNSRIILCYMVIVLIIKTRAIKLELEEELIVLEHQDTLEMIEIGKGYLTASHTIVHVAFNLTEIFRTANESVHLIKEKVNTAKNSSKITELGKGALIYSIKEAERSLQDLRITLSGLLKLKMNQTRETRSVGVMAGMSILNLGWTAYLTYQVKALEEGEEVTEHLIHKLAYRNLEQEKTINNTMALLGVFRNEQIQTDDAIMMKIAILQLRNAIHDLQRAIMMSVQMKRMSMELLPASQAVQLWNKIEQKLEDNHMEPIFEGHPYQLFELESTFWIEGILLHAAITVPIKSEQTNLLSFSKIRPKLLTFGGKLLSFMLPRIIISGQGNDTDYATLTLEEFDQCLHFNQIYACERPRITEGIHSCVAEMAHRKDPTTACLEQFKVISKTLDAAIRKDKNEFDVFIASTEKSYVTCPSEKPKPITLSGLKTIKLRNNCALVTPQITIEQGIILHQEEMFPTVTQSINIQSWLKAKENMDEAATTWTIKLKNSFLGEPRDLYEILYGRVLAIDRIHVATSLATTIITITTIYLTNVIVHFLKRKWYEYRRKRAGTFRHTQADLSRDIELLLNLRNRQ